MGTLSEALPELVGDVVGALIREGRGHVADQLPHARLSAWTFDDFAQSTYLHLAASRDPNEIAETISFQDDIGVIAETISFQDDIGVNVDLDKGGRVVGLEVFGYEQSLARLGKDPGGTEPVEARSDSRQKRIEAGAAEVFAALGDPARVARWWGPEGFTNTIDEFQFHAGGLWRLTMHGPDGTDYPNENRFVRIVPGRTVEIEHLSGHHFMLTIGLVAQGQATLVAWQQTFDTAAHYERIAAFVAKANEQNLERLAAEVLRAKGL
jgi:uncharacterized protein YndB with AHSA1/START domain/uncharacterized protein YuzE